MQFRPILALYAGIICTAQVIDYGPKNYTYLMQQACQDPSGPWRSYAPNGKFPIAQEYLESIREASLVPGLLAMEVTSEDLSIAPVGQRRCLSAPLINETDLMPLGSVGKALTATLIAKLVEEGSLSWDTTIGEVFTNVTSLNKQHSRVTVRMLASQHSGISNNTRWQDTYFWNNEVYASTYRQQRDNYLKWALAQDPVYKANTTFLYSNINYIVLGAIVDRVIGTWEDVIREKLFKPLAMNCGFGAAPQRGYRGDEIDNPWPHTPHYDYSTSEPDALDMWNRDATTLLGSAGNIYCDATSYATFARLHLDALLECPESASASDAGDHATVQYLSCESFRILHTPHNGYYTAGGWYSGRETGSPSEDRDFAILWHRGTNLYNNAYSYISTRDKKAYLAFTNMGDDEGEEAVDRVIDAFSEGKLNLADDVAPCSSYMPAVTSHIPQFTFRGTDADGQLTYESIKTRTVYPDVSTPVGLPLAACTAAATVPAVSRYKSAASLPTKSSTILPSTTATVQPYTGGSPKKVNGFHLLALCYASTLIVIFS